MVHRWNSVGFNYRNEPIVKECEILGQAGVPYITVNQTMGKVTMEDAAGAQTKGRCGANWWLEHGRKLLQKETLRNRDFHAHFGVSPFIVDIVWGSLCERGGLPKGLQHQHLLWALCWLKVYATDSVMLSILNLKSEKTFKKYRDMAMEALYELENVSRRQSFSSKICKLRCRYLTNPPRILITSTD